MARSQLRYSARTSRCAPESLRIRVVVAVVAAAEAAAAVSAVAVVVVVVVALDTVDNSLWNGLLAQTTKSIRCRSAISFFNRSERRQIDSKDAGLHEALVLARQSLDTGPLYDRRAHTAASRAFDGARLRVRRLEELALLLVDVAAL